MVEVKEKSDQVRRQEGKLQICLWPCLADNVLGWGNRKCYTFDADGNISGLNRARYELADWSVLRELITSPLLRTLNLEGPRGARRLVNEQKAALSADDDEERHFHYPTARHSYVVNLMKKFAFCYELNPQTILVPDLLDVARPTFEFPAENLLRFRCEFDFLPRSVLPRFIVRWHSDIEDELRCRTGVVVRDSDLDARAVVWSGVRDRKIMIDVSGRDRREYFCRIRAESRKIHDTFLKLDLTEKVLLPEGPDFDVDYADLIQHEEEGQRQILVEGVRRKYDV